MKYYVATDDDGYVMLIKRTGTIKDYVDLDLSLYDLSDDRMYAYKLGDNALVFDQTRYDEILAEKQEQADQEEIETLKEYLNETDYVMARTLESIMTLAHNFDPQTQLQETFVDGLIDICKGFYTQYSSTIAERIDARNRIEELEQAEVTNG